MLIKPSCIYTRVCFVHHNPAQPIYTACYIWQDTSWSSSSKILNPHKAERASSRKSCDMCWCVLARAPTAVRTRSEIGSINTVPFMLLTGHCLTIVSSHLHDSYCSSQVLAAALWEKWLQCSWSVTECQETSATQPQSTPLTQVTSLPAWVLIRLLTSHWLCQTKEGIALIISSSTVSSVKSMTWLLLVFVSM